LAFTCVALFAVLQEPLGHLSEIISRIAAAFVGADRICKFLQRERLPQRTLEEQGDSDLPGIVVENLSLRYPGQSENSLTGISFSLLPGESLAVVGPVGAGKSTLIQALLQEVPLAEGF